MNDPQVKRVLISVTDKTGVVEFAQALSQEFGAEIISTGGTARVLAEACIPVRPIDDLTGFPEMMDGRVKTLHPKVHGGLLARRDLESHMADAEANGIQMIDMIVVNLYAFEATVRNPEATYQDCIENIDIGGPSMLRSAAKNHASVAVVTRPETYDAILEEMRANDGATTLATRQKLALDVFRTTSAYDNAIFSWLQEQQNVADVVSTASAQDTNPLELVDDLVLAVDYPKERRLFLEKKQELRYGENPHQRAAFYTLPLVNATMATLDATSLPELAKDEYALANAEQIQGKELSYNNFLDLDAAWAAVREFDGPACVIVKHLTPCGIATDEDLVQAYKRAHECDPVSAYGGVMAFNRTVPAALVEAIYGNGQFIEGVVAPDYEDGALELFTEKPNARILRTGGMNPVGSTLEYRAVEGGMLVQRYDAADEDPLLFDVASKRQPTDAEMDELLFAWKACKTVKSNAILISQGHATVGVGAGQPNRVNSARIAVEQAGEKAKGAVAASDAFMPFADSMEVLVEAGVTAVIQPGGSIRDDEVLSLADANDIAVVFTGHRHFRH